MNIKAQLPEHMPKCAENLDKLDEECIEEFICDKSIEGQNAKPFHEPDCHDDCRWHECLKPCVAFASVITSFLAQEKGRIKAVVAGRRDPRSTLEALKADPIAWSESIDEEYPKLVEMGVIDDNNGKGYTRKQLEAEGIFLDDMKAAPLGLYHTHQ